MKYLAHKHKGFSLLEVLIAMFILVGALYGFAKLQLKNTQAFSSAYARTQAVSLIEEMIAKLQTQRQSAVAGLFDIPPSSITDIASYSSSSDLYKKLTYSWVDSVENILPGAKGAIKCDVIGICVVSIKFTHNTGNLVQTLRAKL